jgi:hypothetical protein
LIFKGALFPYSLFGSGGYPQIRVQLIKSESGRQDVFDRLRPGIALTLNREGNSHQQSSSIILISIKGAIELALSISGYMQNESAPLLLSLLLVL